mmetsp:Transcript_43156/g.111877  ORF Transcript_43156/g.111877 Transcript_43156/m.111877 type:complete len:85 (+) Transcript_43156:2480-2734(+)
MLSNAICAGCFVFAYNCCCSLLFVVFAPTLSSPSFQTFASLSPQPLFPLIFQHAIVDDYVLSSEYFLQCTTCMCARNDLLLCIS